MEKYDRAAYLLPGIPIPTGKEMQMLTEKEQMWWIRQVLSVKYDCAWEQYEMNYKKNANKPKTE